MYWGAFSSSQSTEKFQEGNTAGGLSSFGEDIAGDIRLRNIWFLYRYCVQVDHQVDRMHSQSERMPHLIG